MKANLALAFILAGISLWLHNRDSPSPLPRRVRRACALAVAIIGGLTLLEYILAWDAGIDQMMFREAPGAVGTLAPGRMAPTAALNLLIVGIALLLIERRKSVWIAQLLAIFSGLVAMQASVNYLFGARDFSGVGAYTQMAIHAGMTFAVLSAGLLCARPRAGVTTVLSSGCVGGVMTRSLLPAVLLIPFVIGWMDLEGRRLGLYSADFGVTVCLTGTALILFAVVWHNGLHLCRLDEKRKAAEESARQMKNDFLSMVHHELTTPITVISGTVSLLRESDAGVAAVSQSHYLEVVDRNARRLSRLAADIIDITRLETDTFKLAKEKIDIWMPIRAACEDLAHHPGKKLEMAIPAEHLSPPFVMADAQRIEQVASNLLKNALRFAKSRVRVHVESANEHVNIIVDDDGPGVEPHDIPHLFEKFYRGRRQVGTKRDGAGLGLAIVKGIVEAHGGKVWVETKPAASMESGSRFIVALPAAVHAENHTVRCE